MEVLPLFPFSAGELEGTRERLLSRLFDGPLAKARPASRSENLASRLVRGGYPEAVRRRAEDRRAAWSGSYISTILQRGVRDLARVDALHTLPHGRRL